MESSVKPNFNFGTTNNQNDKVEKPVEGSIDNPSNEENRGKEEEVLNSPYTDIRTVTIALREDYSLYRQVNQKVLPKRQDYIGSSYNSSLILTSNKKEIEAYFPSIIGLAPTHNDFVTRVKQYFGNIRVGVDEQGKKLDISFNYGRKRDYIKFYNEEEKINAEYDAIDKHNVKALKEGLKKKINALNALESTKYQYGSPVNVADYILYRHCLLYPDVAKESSLINGMANIRFFFKDDKREAEKAKRYRTDVLKAKQNYINCMADPALFEAVFIQYCKINNLSVGAALQYDELDKETRLDKFSISEPIKFNKICANKDNKLIGTIEKLIAYGELNVLPNTQNIITTDGQFVGANMNEALAWFKSPENTAAVNSFMNKLNNR